MSEGHEPEVYIERQGRIFRWGDATYLKDWNGFKFTYSTKILKTIALPLALTLAFCSFYRNKKITDDDRSKEFLSPSISASLPMIDSKIQNEQDLINRIKRPPVAVSPLGGIRVFSLSNSNEIPVGSEATAKLESGATNGIVKAKLTSPILIDGERVIPEQSVLFGSGKSTEERLFVEFSKVVFPNGESVSIRAQAFDISDKIQGLKGSLVGTKSKKMAAAMGFGFLGGMADGLQDTSGSMFSYQQKRSLKDAALSGTSKAALDQSQSYIDEMKNAPNIIEVKRGTEFFLIFDEPKKKEGFKNE